MRAISFFLILLLSIFTPFPVFLFTAFLYMLFMDWVRTSFYRSFC